jgi:uncharacterized membrane protein YgcG
MTEFERGGDLLLVKGDSAAVAADAAADDDTATLLSSNQNGASAVATATAEAAADAEAEATATLLHAPAAAGPSAVAVAVAVEEAPPAAVALTPDRARVCANVAVAGSVLVMGTIAIVAVAARNHIGRLFSSDPRVVETVAKIAPVAALFQGCVLRAAFFFVDQSWGINNPRSIDPWSLAAPDAIQSLRALTPYPLLCPHTHTPTACNHTPTATCHLPPQSLTAPRARSPASSAASGGSRRSWCATSQPSGASASPRATRSCVPSGSRASGGASRSGSWRLPLCLAGCAHGSIGAQRSIAQGARTRLTMGPDPRLQLSDVRC